MKVVVTGGLGFIGSHLSRSLMKDGHDVTIIDDCSVGHIRYSIKDILNNVNHIQCDLACSNIYHFAHKALEQAEQIYHLASVIGSKHILNDSYRVITKNTDMTKNVLENSSCPILFVSSTEVENGSPTTRLEPTHEHDLVAWDYPFSNRWVYALSKFFCESLIMHHSPGRCSMVRLSNVYGPDTLQEYVMKVFINKLIRDPEYMGVVHPNDTRHFVYVDDIIEGIKMISAHEHYGSDEIYNLGHPSITKIIDLADIIRDILGANTEILPIEEPEEVADHRFTSFEKVKSILGWEATTDLDRGITNTISIDRKNNVYA